MTFADDIAQVAEKVQKRSGSVSGEEATKMALIVPFLSVLGYDVSDPTEVMPEYEADFAIKKSGQKEKVDYAISIKNSIVMIVEAKAINQKPQAHDGQLRKYFNGLISAKVAIVTNGIEYLFYTDLRNDNLMDDEPFFIFNILNYDDKQVENLKLFHRDNFDAVSIKAEAEGMVYINGMTQLIDSLLRSPSDEFIRFLISQLRNIDPRYAIEKVTSKTIQKFQPIVQKSIQESLVNLMTKSISQSIGQPINSPSLIPIQEINPDENNQNDLDQTTTNSKIVTTEEELAAFAKIKAIVAQSKYSLEINHKDVVAYFGVNIIGKSNAWFLRLYLSPKKKSFVTRLSVEEVKNLSFNFEVQEMPASSGEAKSRVTISSIDDLDSLSDLILKCYETEASKLIS